MLIDRPLVTISSSGFQVQNVEPSSGKNGSLILFGHCFFSEKGESSEQVQYLCAELLAEHFDKLDLDDIIIEIQRLYGSWAFAYYRTDLRRILIGRDAFGRKSLLWSRRGDELLLSPFVTGFSLSWSEVPSGTVSVLDCENLWDSLCIFSAREALDLPWIRQFADVSLKELEELHRRLLTVNRSETIDPEFRNEQEQFLDRFCGAVQRCLGEQSVPPKAVAVLFSGGVDSLLVASVVRRYVPMGCLIDLINVSFDEKSKDFSGAPDRRRGIKAYRYLKSRHPETHYRLILVNVGRTELANCRSEFIAPAVMPSCSVLDDSIGCVQWFAARGEGLVFEADEASGSSPFVRSEALVVLVGSGADEVFGGYMRHRHCFTKHGRTAVLDELEKELRIIGERNLGRDDRIACNHNREARAPYLDDWFLEWANGLPLEVKADFTKGRGIGEKMIIRQALKTLGVPEDLYTAPKQAMQFGTRIAHLENMNEKGSDLCARLVSLGVDDHVAS